MVMEHGAQTKWSLIKATIPIIVVTNLPHWSVGLVCVCVCVCLCVCDVMLWSVLDGGVMGRAWGGFFSPTLPWVNRCYRYQHCHGFSFAPGTHLTWDYFSHIWVLSQCVHPDKTLHCHFTICLTWVTSFLLVVRICFAICPLPLWD